MARKPKRFTQLFSAAEKVVHETTDARELRMAQSVLLPGLLGVSLAETAQVIGRSKATVTRLRSRFAQGAEDPETGKSQWGGRRRQNMTPDEEQAFLAPFFSLAEGGGILVVAPIQAAYERVIGRKVPESTVYRLLARHGWRKIAPGKGHPKSDPAAQEEWKKNFQKR